MKSAEKTEEDIVGFTGTVKSNWLQLKCNMIWKPTRIGLSEKLFICQVDSIEFESIGFAASIARQLYQYNILMHVFTEFTGTVSAVRGNACN